MCFLYENDIEDLPKTIGNLKNLRELSLDLKIIASFLKPGGFFYIAECHPFSYVFDNETKDIKELQVFYNYFHDPKPLKFVAVGSYASIEAKIKPKKEYEWFHNMSDIINSLIEAGLRIEFLNEYPFTVWKQFPFAEREPTGFYYLKNQKVEIPLLFTLKATK